MADLTLFITCFILISLRLATRKQYMMDISQTRGSIDLGFLQGTYVLDSPGSACSGEYTYLSDSVSLQDCAIMVAGACLQHECWFTYSSDSETSGYRICRKQNLGTLFTLSVEDRVTCTKRGAYGRDLYKMTLNRATVQKDPEPPSLYYLEMMRMAAAIYVAEGVGMFYKYIKLERKVFDLLGVELAEIVEIPFLKGWFTSNTHIGIFRRVDSTNKCYVVFQGTNNIIEDTLMTDANAIPTWYDYCGSRLHYGTWLALKEMVSLTQWQNAKTFLKNNCTTVDAVGHSLGGMLASLLIACYNNDDGDNLQLKGIPFEGAYSIGGGAFSWGELKNEHAPHELNGCFKGHRFFNADDRAFDPITRIGQLVGFSHPHMLSTRLHMKDGKVYTTQHACEGDAAPEGNAAPGGNKTKFLPDMLLHYPQVYAGRMALVVSKQLKIVAL
eukprot:TRINITY_DN19456_c0_g3_i1.p1 TRINITY_DN19456_c0_g3~~TRINITY_DN19456_c0_g3_i1.p1  ORF type:complete len:441 (-),score=41.26 TRINITY_DN19456_c0_g3_i1:114-1436(-)